MEDVDRGEVELGARTGPVLCPTLVGRQAELGALAELSAAVAAGHGGTLLVLGEAGIGKSRLVRETAAVAGARGQLVLLGRAVQSDQPVAFRPLSEALLAACRGAGPPSAPALAPYRAALGRLVPEWQPAVDLGAEVSPVILGEALVRVLPSLAGRAGCVLLLEDLHWADPDTLAVFEYLSDHVGDQTIGCVVTLRSDEPGPGLALARSLASRRSARLLEPRRLTRGEVDAMARACLGAPDLPAVVHEALLVRADGLPFLVEELLATSIDAGVLVRHGTDWTLAGEAEVVVPHTFADTIRRRLAALGEAPVRVLRAAALLGQRFDWSILARVTGLDEATLAAALRRAVDAQLVVVERNAFRFRHALTRDAVLGELLPHERAELAVAALAVLDPPGQLPGAACEVLAQLAEEAGDRRRAAAFLLQAGRRAAASGALDTAETTLERARGYAAQDLPGRLAIDEALTETLALAGKVDRVLELGGALAATLETLGAPPAQRAEVQLRLARAAVAATRWPAAAEHLAAARQLAAAADEERLAPRIDAVAAQAAIGAGRVEDALVLADAALEAAERVGLHEVACEALEVLGRCARPRDLDAAEVAFGRALALAETHALPVYRLRALHELGTVDMFRRSGVERLEQARELAWQAGALGTAAILDLQLASARVVRFEPELALAAARRAAGAARQLQLGLALPRALVQEAACWALLGQRAEMEAAIRAALAVAGDDLDVAGGAWGLARALCSLLQERRGQALAELEQAMALVRQQPSTLPYPFRPLWALLRTVEGVDDGAARAEVQASGIARGLGLNRALLGYAEAVALGRAGQPTPAAAAFAATDADLAGQGAHEGFRQLSRRLVAEAALAHGWGDPVAWLREAAAFFERTGHRPVVAACRSLLRTAGAPLPRRGRGEAEVPPALQQLGVTSREMDVLALVGEGLTNREIGRRLFLSPRTVEKHIEQLLAKTGARSRRELAASATQAGPPRRSA